MWTKIEGPETLPAASRKVFVVTVNLAGCTRRLRAYYVPKFTVEQRDEDSDWFELCEDDDTHYVPEGWYECCEGIETDAFVSTPVTHWQPLPPLPESETATLQGLQALPVVTVQQVMRFRTEALNYVAQLEASLSQFQQSEFHPDWSLLQASQESLREHMALLKGAQSRITELEGQVRGGA